jgi:glyoxylase-like metal-dependent hydrolase (beta-lactamase superfamily II)
MPRGAQAFPPSTILIRPVAQQKEMDLHGAEFIERFRGISAIYKELLQDATLRPADLTFDSEAHLDLGGVTVRLFWLGPAHTIGDELIFVEPDSALLPGDIVMSKLVPNMPSSDSSPKNWLAILDKLEPLHPRYVVPDHGDLGDASLIGRERAFLGDLQQRAIELKREGKPVQLM